MKIRGISGASASFEKKGRPTSVGALFSDRVAWKTQRFISSKNSLLFFVAFSLSRRNSIDSSSSMS